MKNYRKKRQNNRKKMDIRKKMEYRKRIQIKNPAFSPKELRKKQANEIIKYPDYPQSEGMPNLPLPVNISFALKTLEAGLFEQIDEFYPMGKIEELTQTQYAILAAGVKSNMSQLQMNEIIWNNLKNFADRFADGNTSQTFNLLVAVNYRIHLEVLRMITGKSLMDILYHGEINIQNEFDAVDNEFYKSLGRTIYDMLLVDHNLDINRLTLKDIDEFHPAA